jgi:hypothetical protein
LKLDLSNNALSISGAEALSNFLYQASSLQVLLVNNCGLGIDGVTIICEQLKRGTPNLEILVIKTLICHDLSKSHNIFFIIFNNYNVNVEFLRQYQETEQKTPEQQKLEKHLQN